VSLLTRAPKDTIPDRIPTKPPPIKIDSDEEWEVEEILDSRIQKRVLQYLVKWKGYTISDNTWEPAKNLTNAPDEIRKFHQRHPEAPKQISATTFAKLSWQPLVNYMLPQKKEEVRRILHSRGLVP
jgi:hypothetical protein